ncbi:restriction endonuclease subunit S [Aliarcobacter lanthieri]|uniref:restriction endonuclease subunit S n=1 Tax=Aliarcobacter lanthieri TaxID=1355374 RepID=UPI003AABA873
MSNVPKLRFKEFSGEWNKERFGELCGFEQGVQVDVELQTKEQSDDLVRFIRIENYTQNSSDFRFIPKELAKKKSIDEKEIAIVRYGATAGFIGRGFSGVLANNLFKLKPNHKLLDDEYLYHYLKSYKAFHFFQSEMAGGAMPALSFGIVKALKLPYPSKQEQENIASFLTSVDTKIEQLTKKEQLLQQYKKGVMQKIFNQEIRFKAYDGSEFCEWEEKSLNELVEFSNGKAHENDIDESGDYIVVNSKFISSNGTVKKYSNSQIAPLYKNDIVMVMSDVPNGKALSKCYLIDENNKYTLNQRICSLRQTINNNKFLIYLINRNKYYLAFDSGVGQTNLRKDEVLNLKLKVPCLEEQNKIANFLSSIDCKIEQTQKQLESSKEFKKALLQQMFV